MFDPLYTAEEMRAAEAGHDVEALMDRAGKAVADRVLADHPGAVTVVCGGGNNGGDGRVAARYLAEAGRDVTVVDAKADETDLGQPDVVVDALFGTGFTGEPREDAARLIEAMNRSGAEIVAVDLPSGVNASTGEVAGAAIDAACSVSFHGPKVGHFVTPGGLHTAGSVLVVGGSEGMTGAAALSACAAFRADAGYVAVASPRESIPVLETLVLEAVKRPLDDVFEAAGRAGALAIGPGLGRGDEAKGLVRQLLEETDLPAVVDADALFGLEPFSRKAPTVLTPHAGELARLLGVESGWVDAHRLQALDRAVERFGCAVLLKGFGTVVGAPGEGVLVCDGEPALATAGTGDVLTGIVGAFLAKGMDARLAAAAAATAHTLAARTFGRPGLVASDVVEALPQVLSGAV